MRPVSILVFYLIFFFFSCGGRETEKQSVPVPGRSAIEEVNRSLLQKDLDRIESYIERRGLEMKMTPTGLWYMIIEPGKGDSVKNDDLVSINYRSRLLDGTELYTSSELGLKSIRIGRSTIEAGLDEGLRLLRGGGSALLILPSHLAFGLLGDGDKIPSRAILVYEIEVVGHNGKEFIKTIIDEEQDN
jgi:FKBP-type peptidyl-prolyl cis-trans isomerase